MKSHHILLPHTQIDLVSLAGGYPDLANQVRITLDDGAANEGLVVALYDALNARDVGAVHALLAADLEWWFHGPPSYQFLRRLLTGSDNKSQPFLFRPVSITAIGSLVLAEGYVPSRSIAWVHAWTVTDGIITQVREYFNTSVTVTRLGNGSGSEITPAGRHHFHCPPIWESRLANRVGKSVPGLVLAL